MVGKEKKPHDDIVYGRYALREAVPWITPKSLEQIESLIQPSWSVFEWGSGGSTAYWARKCSSVISVEHNSEWIARTTKILQKRNLHATIKHIRRDEDGTFHNYADAILEYDDESFDLVFVDGEASCRGWCVTNAIPKVKACGILLLDNSDWLKRDLGDEWKRTDYVVRDLKWIGQKGTFNWWTSILVKKNG